MSTKQDTPAYSTDMMPVVDFRLEREKYTQDFRHRLEELLLQEGQKIQRRLVLSRLAVFVGSLSSIVFVLVLLGRSITTSGFYDYASIIFLDFNLALTYSKEIVLSMIESLPVLIIVLFVLLTVTFVWSVRSLNRLGGWRFMNRQKAYN